MNRFRYEHPGRFVRDDEHGEWASARQAEMLVGYLAMALTIRDGRPTLDIIREAEAALQEAMAEDSTAILNANS